MASRPEVQPTTTQNGGCARGIGIGCLVLLCLPGLGILLGIIGGGIGLFGAGLGLFGAGMASVMSFPPIAALGVDGAALAVAVLLLLLSVVIILFALIYTVVYYMRHSRMPKAGFVIVCLLLWLLSIVGSGVYIRRAVANTGSTHELQMRMSELEQLLKQNPDSMQHWLEQAGTHSYYYEYSRDADGNEYEYEEQY